MSEYYYLNAQRTPCGPHSLDELSEMLTRGIVCPTTLVACSGAASWEPLGSVLSRESHAASPTLNALAGSCPSCGHPLSQDLANGQLPDCCPKCRHRFKPEQAGIWGNFRLALHHYCEFKGRATRAEYWSFTLVNILVWLGLFMLLLLTAITAAAATEKGGTLVGVACVIFILPMIVWWFYVLLPGIAVMVRRLHDVGWSGWWVLVNFLSGFAPTIILIIFNVMGVSEDDPLFLSTVLLSSIVSNAFGLLILVLCVLDSQRGANKYGPSAKYPLG